MQSLKRPKATALAGALSGSSSFAPIQPSPLQPMPAFSYGELQGGAVAGPSGSNGNVADHHHQQQQQQQGGGAGPSRSSSSGTPGGLNGTLTGGIATGYESPYGPGYATPTYPSGPSSSAQASSSQHAAASYPPPYAGAPAATPASYPAHAGYYGPRTAGSGFYDPFSVSAPSGGHGTRSAAAAAAASSSSSAAPAHNVPEIDHAAALQRQALESLAAQALSFNVGQAVHGTPGAGTAAQLAPEPEPVGSGTEASTSERATSVAGGAGGAGPAAPEQQARASSAPTSAPPPAVAAIAGAVPVAVEQQHVGAGEEEVDQLMEGEDK